MRKKLIFLKGTSDNSSQVWILNNCRKVHTTKVVKYNKWLEKHTRQRHYCFQIRKCEDCSCCSEPRNKNLVWLPDPVLDDFGNHYLTYCLLKYTDTTEDDRPSLKKCLKLERPRKSQMLLLQLPAQLMQEWHLKMTLLAFQLVHALILSLQLRRHVSLSPVLNAESHVFCIQNRNFPRNNKFNYPCSYTWCMHMIALVGPLFCPQS